MKSSSEKFFDFVNERESIRQRKLADLPFPWTEDPILQTYKFTNVHRHHDRTSNLLRHMFYGPNFHDHMPTILMNCALFRYFGTWEFAKAVGWQNYETFDFNWIKDLAKVRLSQKERVFTGAYIITNQGISAPKQEVVVDIFLKGLHEVVPRIVDIAHRTQSWEQTAAEMRSIKGFGGTGFMTKEVLLDTTYTGFWSNIVEHPVDGTFSFPCDWEDWTPIGPGARRGAARILSSWELNSKYQVSEQVAREVINDLVTDQVFYYKHEEVLVPTDIQFQLCEFDKYERVRLGQGRPRSKYRRPAS